MTITGTVCKAYVMLLISFFLFAAAKSQSTLHIKGIISDTAEHKPLGNANIVLLRAIDSIMVTHTRASKDGSFALEGLTPGAYLIMISYPKYADFLEKIVLTDKSLDLKTIPLVTTFYLLKEIVIKSPSAAIRIKGDTTEFTADSFKVTPNADVQELLRKMPGFQINAKGEITAQGEKVQKVLVDGEEFFSDDPAVVTKNLRADAVEKVQLFDKKSDQAAFTGIEDGERTKTINLKIKEDSKKGYFGKIEGSSNGASYGNGKAMANAFKAKRKFSVYATTTNTEFEGLNWQEDRNYNGGGNMTTEISEDGGIMMMYQGETDNADNKGLPNQQTAGVYYGNKWGGFNLTGAGQFQRLRTNAEGSSYTKSLLNGYALENNTNSKTQLDKKRYKFNSTQEWGTDSTGLFKLMLKGSNVLKSSDATYEGQTDSDSRIINSSIRKIIQQEDDKNGSASLSYRRKLNKPGRSITVNADINLNSKQQDGQLFSENTFYSTGLPSKLETIDQQKNASLSGSTTNANVVYTEPITKKTFLLFRYGLSLGTNDAARNTFGKTGAGSYTDLVDSLSNHFLFNTNNNNGSISYRYVGKKANLVFGTGLGRVQYQTKDLEKNLNRSIAFNNFLPSLAFTYKPKQQRNLNINYTGSPVNPTLQQIQPLIDNTDPLNISIGNKDLVQGFTNRVNWRISDFKVLKSRYIFINGDASNTVNAITSSSRVDANGKTTSQFVNTNGMMSYALELRYDMDIIKGINGGLGIGHNFNRYINFVNDIRNENDNLSKSLSINISYWGDRWYNFYVNFNIASNKTTSSIQKGSPTRFTTYMGYGNADFKFKKIKTYISLSSEYRGYGRLNEQTPPRSIFLFNPSLRKVITKNDALEIKLTSFDLFNQNADVSRNVSSNFISESVNNTIRRYFLLGLVYNFKNKMATVPVQ